MKKNVTAAISILFLVSGFLSSCCKTYTCIPGSGTITLVNFPLNETQLIVLRRYQLNTNFTSKIDTVLYDISGYSTVLINPYGNNAGVTPSIRGYKFFLEPGYDYEVVLPAARRISRITDVTATGFEQEFCGFAKPGCRTIVYSLKVDGVEYAGNAVITK